MSDQLVIETKCDFFRYWHVKRDKFVDIQDFS